MVDHQSAEEPIFIHIVAFGEGIPLGDYLFAEEEGHSYARASGNMALQEILTFDSNANVLFFNMDPVDYAHVLQANYKAIGERNPLLVTPEKFRERMTNSGAEGYGIQFVSMTDKELPLLVGEVTKPSAGSAATENLGLRRTLHGIPPLRHVFDFLPLVDFMDQWRG